MNRRNFMGGTAATAIAASTAGAIAAAPARRPNVLYVFSDQHRAQAMPGEPYSPVVAPNLATFRRDNLSMDGAVSNYPLCTPHRGMLMTGRWPFHSGITHNGAWIDQHEYALGTAFSDAGYRTAYVGKWHLQEGHGFVRNKDDRHGFQDWHVWEQTNAHYDSITFDAQGKKIETDQSLPKPQRWNCKLMTDQAIELITGYENGGPWMMVVSWNPPHFPFDPPDEYLADYPAGSLNPMPPNVRRSLEGQEATGIAKALTSIEELRRSMRGYYASVTGVDAEFGRLLAALEATHQADNTIVIYTSDHGEMMGSHGRMAKSVPFEESIRVPFYVRYPGVTPVGASSKALFGSIDIYPTVCGLAGIPVPNHCEGRDMSPVMRGETMRSRPVFLMNDLSVDGSSDEGRAAAAPAAEADSHKEVVVEPTYRGIRTDTHTYAVADSGRWCLFDNVKDPHQQTNLVNVGEHKQLIEQLDAQIMAWLKKAGDPFPYAQAIKRVSNVPT